MSKKAKFEVGNLVCHKEQGMGIGQIKQVLRDHAYKVDFGSQGVFKLHESVLEGVSKEKASEPEFEGLMRQANDPVNAPAHYTQNGDNECIDVMRWLFGDEAVMAFCRCNIFKYRFRAGMKNGEQDIAKAVWYENYLRKMLNENSLKGENKQ